MFVAQKLVPTKYMSKITARAGQLIEKVLLGLTQVDFISNSGQDASKITRRNLLGPIKRNKSTWVDLSRFISNLGQNRTWVVTSVL